MFRAEPSFDFKGSYRKANRSRIDSFTGIGDEKALALLAEILEARSSGDNRYSLS